jgi:hypothetical protein
MAKRRPRDTFTVHVKQQSDGGVRIEIDGRRSGTCMFALMMYAFMDFSPRAVRVTAGEWGLGSAHP